jgi:NADH:ubiquinone oxidoreductase subunit 4 (subunit M)
MVKTKSKEAFVLGVALFLVRVASHYGLFNLIFYFQYWLDILIPLIVVIGLFINFTKTRPSIHFLWFALIAGVSSSFLTLVFRIAIGEYQFTRDFLTSRLITETYIQILVGLVAMLYMIYRWVKIEDVPDN